MNLSLQRNNSEASSAMSLRLPRFEYASPFGEVVGPRRNPGIKRNNAAAYSAFSLRMPRMEYASPVYAEVEVWDNECCGVYPYDRRLRSVRCPQDEGTFIPPTIIEPELPEPPEPPPEPGVLTAITFIENGSNIVLTFGEDNVILAFEN